MSNTEALRAALAGLLDHYIALVNSGDAGHWNPETEPVVIAARAALAQPAAPVVERADSATGVVKRGSRNVSDNAQPAASGEPAEPPELTSTAVNDACWAFVEAMPHELPGHIFNKLKPAVHAAICKFLDGSSATPMKQTASVAGLMPAEVRAVSAYVNDPPVEPLGPPVALSDERIDAIADLTVKGMPDGIQGFLNYWGWRQFSRALLEDCAGHYRAPALVAPEAWQALAETANRTLERAERREARNAATAKPLAWLCELAQEDGSTRQQIVTENPDGLRWNDIGEPSPFKVTPLYAAQPAPALVPPERLALNVQHPDCHKAADAFWNYWRENGETHKRGYYESTWGAINRALRTVGVVEYDYPAAAPDAQKGEP